MDESEEGFRIASHADGPEPEPRSGVKWAQWHIAFVGEGAIARGEPWSDLMHAAQILSMAIDQVRAEVEN